MTEVIRKIQRSNVSDPARDPGLTQEWLVTNGLGGYASGTVARVPTRRYHGLLIAALPAPFGRTMMLNHLSELVRLADGSTTLLGGWERVGGELDLPGLEHLEEFRMELGLPVWRYRLGHTIIEKAIFMPHLQNTVCITYRLLEGEEQVRIKLKPSVHFRSHDEPVNQPLASAYTLAATDDRYELSNESDLPVLRMFLHGRQTAFTVERSLSKELLYRIEESRGYEYRGETWSPGYFRADLHKGSEIALVASVELWDEILLLSPQQALDVERQRRNRLLEAAHPEARSGLGAEMVLAADQFVISPAGRVEDEARARASGDEARTVIAGYHWFTDWGRDTMISLEGLTLTTGRRSEAGCILRTFAQYVRNGLIPNMFPEGENKGLYHTADATLWFFHAIDRYLSISDDRETLRSLLPKLQEIVESHLHGTLFGIGVDSEDRLLRQGQEGYQLTWMDAKVDGWVVTPRRGKAVEINALWFNALKLLEGWLREENQEVSELLGREAARVEESFNRRFWYEKGGYLYDVVDCEAGGDDSACRPNQIFAISLKYPVLRRERWETVVNVVKDRLLTPVGLRSLAPGHLDYKAQYFGDLRTRDAAYHQGTVWSWLIGPFVDAWLKIHPNERQRARQFLEGFEAHLNQACIGSVSEVFDAEDPYTPRGCIAQAWGVAELLRCWVKTCPDSTGEPGIEDRDASLTSPGER